VGEVSFTGNNSWALTLEANWESKSMHHRNINKYILYYWGHHLMYCDPHSDICTYWSDLGSDTFGWSFSLDLRIGPDWDRYIMQEHAVCDGLNASTWSIIKFDWLKSQKRRLLRLGVVTFASVSPKLEHKYPAEYRDFCSFKNASSQRRLWFIIDWLLCTAKGCIVWLCSYYTVYKS
jgi:hypothetical protein